MNLKPTVSNPTSYDSTLVNPIPEDPTSDSLSHSHERSTEHNEEKTTLKKPEAIKKPKDNLSEGMVGGVRMVGGSRLMGEVRMVGGVQMVGVEINIQMLNVKTTLSLGRVSSASQLLSESYNDPYDFNPSFHATPNLNPSYAKTVLSLGRVSPASQLFSESFNVPYDSSPAAAHRAGPLKPDCPTSASARRFRHKTYLC